MNERTKLGTRVVDLAPATEPPRRLVVELGKRASEDLSWLVDAEDMNKTTIVNRAIQVLRRIMEAQHNGGSITIDDPARGKPENLLLY